MRDEMSAVATALALESGDVEAPVVLEDALVAPIVLEELGVVDAAATLLLGDVELLAGALVRSGSDVDGVIVVVELYGELGSEDDVGGVAVGLVEAVVFRLPLVFSLVVPVSGLVDEVDGVVIELLGELDVIGVLVEE